MDIVKDIELLNNQLFRLFKRKNIQEIINEIPIIVENDVKTEIIKTKMKKLFKINNRNE